MTISAGRIDSFPVVFITHHPKISFGRTLAVTFGRVVAQGGADASWAEGYLLDGSGLRFKRTKQDGTIQYTVYGFNREPLSTFEVAPAGADVHGGTKSVRVRTGGTGASALARALGAFNPGDTVTATVWFKAPSGVAGMLYLTDRKAPQAGDHKAYGRVMRNGGWQQISVSLPTTVATSLWVNLFGDGDGVVYDDLSVSSSGRGVVFSDGFESGLTVVTDPTSTTAWISCGQVNDLIDSTAGAILAWKSDAVYGWGQLLFENRNGTKIYQQGDQLGSPSVLTNAAGAVIGRQKSLPFGERFTGTGEKSLRRYTNHEDGAQLPVYMQARMYLPTYGRFAEVDPVYDHSSDGLNLYSYVSNNPITSSDPDGMRVADTLGGRTTQYEAPPDDVDFMDETKAWMETVGVVTSVDWYQNGVLIGTTKAETTALTFTFQATAAIHEDSVTGPVSLDPQLNLNAVDPSQSVVSGTFQGDGAGRTFDSSNNIDMGSTRINLIFNVNLTLTNGRLTGISASVPKAVASDSHELSPDLRTGPNQLNFSVTSSFNGARGGTVSFSASASNSLSPGSSLAPIRINGDIHFSSTGAYQGMKGTTSGYPWMQIRGFEGGRTIDNVTFSPAIRFPLTELWKTAPFQSGYWR